MTEADVHRHIGRLEGVQMALSKEINEIKVEQAAQRAMLGEILEIVNKGQGGWKVLVGMGILVTGIIALIANAKKLIMGD